jgi:hypothetical protein
MMQDLEVIWSQTRLFGDAGQHLRADLFAIMERSSEAFIAFADKLSVRAFTDANIFDPANAMQCAENLLRLRTWPVAQAAANWT